MAFVMKLQAPTFWKWFCDNCNSQGTKKTRPCQGVKCPVCAEPYIFAAEVRDAEGK